MTPDKPTVTEMVVDIGGRFPTNDPFVALMISCAAKRALYAEHRLKRATELLRKCLANGGLPTREFKAVGEFLREES